MTYAHIYKCKGGYQVIISTTSDLSVPNSCVSDESFFTKNEAKAFAKAAGAKAWNY